MNENERITIEKYLKKGIRLNKKGWPDFYIFDRNKRQLTVIETKAGNDDLTDEQLAIRDFLIAHGIRYIVEYVKNGESLTVFDSLKHANLSLPNQISSDQSELQHSPHHTLPTPQPD